MDHGVDAAQRLAQDPRVAELDQVAERDPDLDPQAAELARVADQHPDLVAALEQPRHQRLPDGPRCSGNQDHRPQHSRMRRSARSEREPDDEIRQKGLKTLAYVIAEPCIGQKDNSCVEVCPVDCIHPTPDEPDYDNVEQLYIDPDECIDCDACVEACPVDACFAEDQLPEEWAKYTPINAEYFAGK